MMGRDGFRRIGTRRVATGKVVNFTRNYFLAPDGTPVMREIIHHPGSVVVMPVIDGDIVMLRQYRAPVGEAILELPAGKRDVEGEDPALTAARECEEEVGFRPGRLTLLHRFYNSPGYTDELTWLYLAEDMVPVPASPQGAEERAAEIVRLPLAGALQAAAAGAIVDGKSLLGIYLLAGAE